MPYETLFAETSLTTL